MKSYVLAIDQGTSGSKAVLLDEQAEIAGVSEVFTIDPLKKDTGQVEYSPGKLLSSVIDA
ncbi:MAG: carbohydrate kinase, partial [Spirochaetales bacterium]|nr:carbohydrate kinase [Spirochaetales bacterium]